MGAASTFELIIWKTTKHAFKWRLASESVTNENVCDMQSKTVFEAAMSSLLSSSRPFFNDDNYSFFYLSMLSPIKWCPVIQSCGWIACPSWMGQIPIKPLPDINLGLKKYLELQCFQAVHDSN